MAKAVELGVAPRARKRLLLVAQDDWHRFRLEGELKRAGHDVVSVCRLQRENLPKWVSFDVVLTDTSLLADETARATLHALRGTLAEARFMLLLGPGEEAVREQAKRSGYDLVLARPLRAEALRGFVEDLLGESTPRLEPVPVSIEFDFLLEAPAASGKRRAAGAFTSLVVLLLPMVFTESLPLQELAETWLVAPPPPHFPSLAVIGVSL